MNTELIKSQAVLDTLRSVDKVYNNIKNETSEDMEKNITIEESTSLQEVEEVKAVEEEDWDSYYSKEFDKLMSNTVVEKVPISEAEEKMARFFNEEIIERVRNSSNISQLFTYKEWLEKFYEDKEWQINLRNICEHIYRHPLIRGRGGKIIYPGFTNDSVYITLDVDILKNRNGYTLRTTINTTEGVSHRFYLYKEIEGELIQQRTLYKNLFSVCYDSFEYDLDEISSEFVFNQFMNQFFACNLKEEIPKDYWFKDYEDLNL